MLVMYDPVSRGTVTAPTNMVHRAINIQPQYRDKWASDNIIARVGGRHPVVTGAKTVPWYGGSPEYFGPQSTRATHLESKYPLTHTVNAIDAPDAKTRNAQAPVVTRRSTKPYSFGESASPFSLLVADFMRRKTP